MGALLFQGLGSALGRTVQADPLQYLAVYFCGGIRNLNEYVKISHSRPDVFGKMTFPYVNNFLGNRLHNSSLIYALDLPYLSANGRNSGNIYTTFYAYIYDFGYLGVAIMPFIMGMISKILYKRAIKGAYKSNKKIKISIIVYGYVFYTLAFSFFSNKFYEGIFKITFVKMCLIWILVSYILNHINIKTIKLKINFTK
jgi:oligosaccharide repeat unit polymerase